MEVRPKEVTPLFFVSKNKEMKGYNLCLSFRIFASSSPFFFNPQKSCSSALCVPCSSSLIDKHMRESQSLHQVISTIF